MLGGIVTPRLFSADILTLSKRCVKTAESLSRGLMIPSISHTGRDGGEMKGRKSSLCLKVRKGKRKVAGLNPEAWSGLTELKKTSRLYEDFFFFSV